MYNNSLHLVEYKNGSVKLTKVSNGNGLWIEGGRAYGNLGAFGIRNKVNTRR